jgi:hypothetical protein
MSLNFEFPNILSLFEEYKDPKRNNSSAFLIWYLINYYRLDEQEAIDSVCDQKGDKGIDGIYINHSEGVIDIFQTKLTEKNGRTLGDTALKEFVGTLQQIKTEENVIALLNDKQTNQQLKGLIDRTNLSQYMHQYKVRGIFISNMEMDNNGLSYLNNHSDNIIVLGPKELREEYIDNTRYVENNRESVFTIGSSEYLKYSVDENTFAIISPIKASELVKINGISNQEVFSYNVRGHLGNTSVNKGITNSLKDVSLHLKFPLFHNGITVVCEKIDINQAENKLIIKNAFIVNGCQSLSTLYKNSREITENLNILVKFVQVSVDSDLAKTITNFSNNQNGVKARDFKSNNPIQIRLKNEIENSFHEYFFEIKRGETDNTKKYYIINEDAGIWMMSFDLKEPWGTHRKYQIFDDKYNEIFSGPNINGYRIVMLYWFNEIIKEKILDLDNKLMAKYALTKNLLLYILRELLETDPAGNDLIKNPIKYVSEIDRLKKVISVMVTDILIDLNAEVKDLGEDFDYKSKLRDAVWIKRICSDIVSSYKKQVSRNRISSFEDAWNSMNLTS